MLGSFVGFSSGARCMRRLGGQLMLGLKGHHVEISAEMGRCIGPRFCLMPIFPYVS